MTTSPRFVVAPTSTDNSIVVMRQLRRGGVDVVGADDGYLPVWARSKQCRRYHRVPGAADLHVRDYLAAIVAGAGADAIMPVNTPATVAAMELRERSDGKVRTNLPPRESFDVALDKRRCLEECRRLDIACPRVYEPARAAALLARGGDRLVVKPRLDRGGGLGLKIVHDAESLRRAVHHCETAFGGSTIQEFIPGETTRLAMLLVLYDPCGRLVAAFTSRKIRQYPAEGGAATVSESTADARLVEQMIPFFERLRWSGPAEVDLKFDERDGVYKVLEVNPRFPAYLRFVVDCGLDLPLLAARLALDPATVGTLPFPAHAVGRRHVCPGPFARGLLEDLWQTGRRWGKLRAAIADIRGARVMGFWEDPGPFVGRLLRR